MHHAHTANNNLPLFRRHYAFRCATPPDALVASAYRHAACMMPRAFFRCCRYDFAPL